MKKKGLPKFLMSRYFSIEIHSNKIRNGTKLTKSTIFAQKQIDTKKILFYKKTLKF